MCPAYFVLLAIAFQWTSGRIMKMGWTIMEDLLFVQDDGVVVVYDMFLGFKRTFSMGQVSGEFLMVLKLLCS